MAYLSITVYFCHRYYLRRRLPSLVCAAMPLGWVVSFGLENRLPDTTWMPALSVFSTVIACGSIGIILNHELQREHPFR